MQKASTQSYTTYQVLMDSGSDPALIWPSFHFNAVLMWLLRAWSIESSFSPGIIASVSFSTFLAIHTPIYLHIHTLLVTHSLTFSPIHTHTVTLSPPLLIVSFIFPYHDMFWIDVIKEHHFSISVAEHRCPVPHLPCPTVTCKYDQERVCVCGTG